MNLFDKKLDKMLKIDPLLEAEKMTGKSYKEEATSMLGIALHIKHSRDKDALLSLHGDTTYMNTTKRYLEIVGGLGFQVVLTDCFKNEDQNRTETYYVLHHSDGVLLCFDTYGENVNSGKMIYNWKPHDINNLNYDILSSGCWNESGDIWAGDHDCKEAIKHNFNQLKKYGSFLNPWEVKPYTRLLNYMEYRLYSKLDHKRWEEVSKPIELERMSRLPKEVQKMISCNK